MVIARCDVLSVLVEVPTTFGGATETRNLILLDWKVIICAVTTLRQYLSKKRNEKKKAWRTVSDLIPELDVLLGVNDDLLLAIDGNDLGSAVGIARVVDQPANEGNRKSGVCGGGGGMGDGQ